MGCLNAPGDICNIWDIKSIRAPGLILADGTALQTTIYENETINIKIKDYNPNYTYIINALKGQVGQLDENGVFSYTAPDITDGQDTTDTLVVQFSFNNITSLVGEVEFIVKYTDFVLDEWLINDDFELNKSSVTGFDANYVSTQDNAEYIEIIHNQSSDKPDWGNITRTTLYYRPKEISLIADGTTETQIQTEDPLNEGENVYLITSDYKIKEVEISTVTQAGTTHTLDFFGDGSGYLVMPLDGNYDVICRDALLEEPSVYDGSPTFTDGVYGQGITFTSSRDGIKFRVGSLPTTNVTVSLFIYPVSTLGVHYFGIEYGTRYMLVNNNSEVTEMDVYGYNGNTNIVADVSVNAYPGWKHVVLTISDGTIVGRIYSLSGTLFSSKTLTNGRLYSSAYFYIGNRNLPQYANAPVGAVIDQIRVFDRPLTTTEIAQLRQEKVYNNGIFGDVGLSAPPRKAFVADSPKVYVDVESDSSSIDIDNNGIELSSTSIEYVADTNQFVSKYGEYVKDGRALQRKIVVNKTGTQLLTPFKSELWLSNNA